MCLEDTKLGKTGVFFFLGTKRSSNKYILAEPILAIQPCLEYFGTLIFCSNPSTLSPPSVYWQLRCTSAKQQGRDCDCYETHPGKWWQHYSRLFIDPWNISKKDWVTLFIISVYSNVCTFQLNTGYLQYYHCILNILHPVNSSNSGFIWEESELVSLVSKQYPIGGKI